MPTLPHPSPLAFVLVLFAALKATPGQAQPVPPPSAVSDEAAYQARLAVVQSEMQQLDHQARRSGYARDRRVGYGLMLGGFGLSVTSVGLLLGGALLEPTGEELSLTFVRAMAGTIGAGLITGITGLIVLGVNEREHPDPERARALELEAKQLRKELKRARKEEQRARKLARRSSLSMLLPCDARGAGLVWSGNF